MLKMLKALLTTKQRGLEPMPSPANAVTPQKICLNHAEATRALGAKIAKCARAGDHILLMGPLGAGKTTLVQGFVKALAPDAEPLSPTFTLLNIYPRVLDVPIYHYDLYRLDSPRDLVELSWFEDPHARITLVEWPDRLGNALPESRLDIAFGSADDRGRDVWLAGDGDWPARLKAMDAAKTN
ncbi:MAG: tRNA (adenosine(37)-N6)-threonylcarbamoyltransferase complex ATPase subunit type 1 TsaE [Pseudomonadota bacterium]